MKVLILISNETWTSYKENMQSWCEIQISTDFDK